MFGVLQELLVAYCVYLAIRGRLFPSELPQIPACQSGPEVIKLFPAQLSMNFFLLINVEMPTVVGISNFMSRKNSILGLSEPEKCLMIFLYL